MRGLSDFPRINSMLVKIRSSFISICPGVAFSVQSMSALISFPEGFEVLMISLCLLNRAAFMETETFLRLSMNDTLEFRSIPPYKVPRISPDNLSKIGTAQIIMVRMLLIDLKDRHPHVGEVLIVFLNLLRSCTIGNSIIPASIQFCPLLYTLSTSSR